MLKKEPYGIPAIEEASFIFHSKVQSLNPDASLCNKTLRSGEKESLQGPSIKFALGL